VSKTAFHQKRWVACASLGVIAALAVWLGGAGGARAPSLFEGAHGFERTQAQETMSALGYHEVISLEKHDDGSWRANAQKNGTHWLVRISPYGIVSARLAPQLGIVLE
jgi:hypothetical protein